MNRCLLLLAWLPAIAWSAPACIDPEPPSQTPPARGGIGGTGRPASPPGTDKNNQQDDIGGIGGTGAPLSDASPIGIVGTVTGFASLCVNGVEIHFKPGVRVTDNGIAASPDKLAVGQMVSIEATISGKGLQAHDIAILHLLEGPITAVDHGGKDRTIRVIGQTVSIGQETRLAGNRLAVGQLVKVSGMAGAGGQVFATRIDPAPDLKHATALGTVVTRPGKTSTINGVAISGVVKSGAALVKGHWNGKALTPTASTPDPTYRFKEKVSRILVEGLVQNYNGVGKITAAGLELSANQAARKQASQLKPNQRVFLEARIEKSGDVVIERLETGQAGRER